MEFGAKFQRPKFLFATSPERVRKEFDSQSNETGSRERERERERVF